jgi:hypothetical protein
VGTHKHFLLVVWAMMLLSISSSLTFKLQALALARDWHERRAIGTPQGSISKQRTHSATELLSVVYVAQRRGVCCSVERAGIAARPPFHVMAAMLVYRPRAPLRPV